MTFEEIRQSHEADKPLRFTHPDIRGTLCFDEDGCLGFMDYNGEKAARLLRNFSAIPPRTRLTAMWLRS